MTEVDTKLTPLSFWRHLDQEFGFTVDVAADASNALCARFYDMETNGLVQDWSGEVVWCNPPYSDLLPWIVKAHESTESTVVMLIPANRTEQRFWQQYIEPYRDGGGASFDAIRCWTPELHCADVVSQCSVRECSADMEEI